MKTSLLIASFLVPSGKTVNVKPVKAATSKTTLSLVFHIREVMAYVTEGNADKAIELLNSDKFRPIQVIRAMIGRDLTEEERTYWNQTEEYAHNGIRNAVSTSRRWQDTNATLRRMIRENAIAGNLDREEILSELRKFAAKIEGVKG